MDFPTFACMHTSHWGKEKSLSCVAWWLIYMLHSSSHLLLGWPTFQKIISSTMRHLYFYAKNILTDFQTLWKLLFFFEKVTTLQIFFYHTKDCLYSVIRNVHFYFFVEKAKKRRPCLPELLIPIGYICSSKKVKAQQSQTIHKITASPIFISTQLLLILLYYLPYFSKKNIFRLFHSVWKSNKKVSLDVIKLKWDFFKVFGTEFLLQWIY